MFLVCGEALFDLFPGDEIGPGALRFDAHAGGSPFNVAVGMARLGGQAALFTGVSRDMLGERLARVIAGEGVDTRYLVRTGRRTTLSVVGLNAGGQPNYAFYGVGSADCSLAEADLPVLDGSVTGLHFGSYSIVVRPVADAFAALAARERRRFIALDPNVRPSIEPDILVWRTRIDAFLKVANLVKVSDEDLRLLYPDLEPIAVAERWALDGPDLVVYTRGDQDVIALRRGETIRVTPPTVAVVDTVGAGDAFQAALLARLSRHDDPSAFLATASTDRLAVLIEHAALAAAITCSRRGADIARMADIETAS